MTAMRSEPLSLSARFTLPGASPAIANSYRKNYYCFVLWYKNSYSLLL